MGGGFRAFSDQTSEQLESATQIALGVVFATVGVVLAVASGVGTLRSWVLLVGVGGGGAAWAAWSTGVLLRLRRRRRALRDAVPATASVTDVKGLGTYADEWHVREFVEIGLLVADQPAPPRRIRVRRALSPEDQALLAPGTVVPILVHPTLPIASIVWDSPSSLRSGQGTIHSGCLWSPWPPRR